MNPMIAGLANEKTQKMVFVALGVLAVGGLAYYLKNRNEEQKQKDKINDLFGSASVSDLDKKAAVNAAFELANALGTNPNQKWYSKLSEDDKKAVEIIAKNSHLIIDMKKAYQILTSSAMSADCLRLIDEDVIIKIKHLL